MTGHRHASGDAGHAEPETEGTPVNWFRVLDVAVWVAVVIVVAIGVEMLIGKVVRERLASDFGRYLGKVSLGSSQAGDSKPGDL